MSGASSTKISFATLYEEWLLKYGDVKERLKNDGNDETKVHALLSAATAARAGFTGGLQCALMEETDNDEALIELWNHTMWDIDRDAAAQLGLLVSLAKASSDYNLCPDADEEASADVDAFFDDYPECVRKDLCELDSDEDESDEEMQEAQPSSKKMTASEPSRRPESHPQHEDTDVVVEKVQPAPTDRNPLYQRVSTAQTTAPRNPYFQENRDDFAANPPHPQQHLANGGKCDALGQRSNNTTWDDFRSQQNPFQTAREYAHAGGENELQGKEYQPSHPQHNPNHKPSEAQEPQQPQNRGPIIPESLKRKFQPPTRNAVNTQQRQTQGENKKKGAILSNGGSNISRPSSSLDDDGELPEALKGLDKELIEKIQNEIMEDGDSITFDDIAGLADAKQTVQELVCWPMKRPDLFTGLRRGPNGLLLFGPPGTGKTLIGKAIAYESKATFFSISSSSLTSKWIGEGEKLVRTLFAVAAYREPAVVFIDEIDSLLTQRKADENEASRRIKTEFLVQLDGTGTSGQGRVLVIGATNRPHELDDAARRRFVKRLYVPLPAFEDRKVLLQRLLEKNKHVLNEKDFTKLAADTDGFSGADLKALCTDAAMGPIRQLGSRALEVDANDVPPISYKHFRQALRGMHPSVAQADLEIYLEWNKTYGSKSMPMMDDDDEENDSDRNDA